MSTKTDELSTRQAADLLGVSVRTIQLWVESGVLEAWKTAGNHRRIFRASVEALIEQRAQGSATVLIVEDDPTLCAFYDHLFSLVEPAVRVEFAGNGFEGLVKLGDLKPKLMVVDVDMPGMDGLEMLRSMQASDAVGAVSIMIVTSLSDAELEARGGVPDGTPCYEKPLSLETFETMLNELPGQHRLKDIGSWSTLQQKEERP